MRFFLFAILSLLPSLAIAQTKHKVDYYIEHPDEARALLKECANDAELGMSFDCQNASRAGAGLLYADTSDEHNFLDEPKYWENNPIARRSQLTRCENSRKYIEEGSTRERRCKIAQAVEQEAK